MTDLERGNGGQPQAGRAGRRALRADHPLKLIGAPGSPYSRKLRAVMRYRRIPHLWIQQGSKDAEGLPEVSVALIPIVVFPGPEGAYHEAAIDTTPLIRRLEGDFAGRSVIPPEPAMAFVDALLEDYADEWLTKCMFHYRWAFPADVELAAQVLPRWRAIDASDAAVAPISKMFAERQIGRLGVVGSNETTAPVIEASYARLLSLLSDRLAESPFVLGRRPASCDFGLFGQLTQLVQFDPTPMALARAEAPRVVAWLDLLDDQSGLGVDDADWLPSAQVTERLRALLAELGRVYAPFLLGNARALETGAEQVECEIDGRPWVQKPFPYQGKCLKVLRDRYRALDAGDRSRVDEILDGSGCETLFS